MIHCTAPALRLALEQVQPVRIAVAYVGTGWDVFINADELQEIILSPTIGSNPRAIEQLVCRLGIGNVHFLDALHAKLYLGRRAALVGSPNLSRNGFADGGNLEMGCLVEGAGEHEALQLLFSELRQKAKDLYPTESSKYDRLAELKRQWRNARRHRVPSFDDEEVTSLEYYLIGSDVIHLAWFRSGEGVFNEAVIREADPSAEGEELKTYYREWTQFRSTDSVAVGDWILLWRCRDDGLPHGRGAVSWMRVDQVIPDGMECEQYPLLAVQLDPHLPADEPFALDRRVIGVIRDLLHQERFSALRLRHVGGEEEVWSLAAADKVVPDFLELAKQEIARRR